MTDLTEESETTTDEETGLTVSDVMEQADEEGIDLYSLDEGESVTFMARVASTTSTKKVTVFLLLLTVFSRKNPVQEVELMILPS